MADLVKIGFHGDEIWAVKDETGSGWAVVKRMCEMLGIQPHGQVEKLGSSPWATTQNICVVAEDGKFREMACISIDSVPLWLATIHASKVRPEVREMLVKLQREARDVLADHFLRKDERHNGLTLLDVIQAQLDHLKAIDRRQRELEAKQARVEEKVAAIEAHNGNTDDFFTVLAWARLIGKPIPVSGARAIGKKAAALSRGRGLSIGTASDERYGAVGTYHRSVLTELLGDAEPF